MSVKITAPVLKAIAPQAPNDVSKFVDPLNETMAKYEINTLHRMAMFLAQLVHESGGFRYVKEIWGPTAAQKRYEGRKDLGNTHAGDGSRYRGRGCIQITGRNNYKLVSAALGVDFVSAPEKLEEPHWAVMSAGWFWDGRDLNEYADKPASWRSKRKEDPFTTITRLINGGLNGLDDRRKYYARAIVALTPLFS